MSNRVKIQYSIDLDELPAELNTLLGKAEHKLQGCHQDIQDLIKSYNPDTLMTMATTKEISDLREGLMAIDLTLGDIMHIIFSYVDYELKSHEQGMEAPPDIEEKLRSLTEAVTAQDT